MNNPPLPNKILIIDDDLSSAGVLETYLKSIGLDVIVVTDPEKAESSIEIHKPRLIFLDYRMSPLTGKDILERLRIRNVRIPVIMVSAYKRPHGEIEMERLGAAAYLAKPYDFNEVRRQAARFVPFSPEGSKGNGNHPR